MFTALSYLLLAYAITSLWEHGFHRSVLHARRRARRAWRRWPHIGALLRLGWFHHHVIHHRRTFLHSPFVQFDTPAQQAALDARVKGPVGARMRADRYGASVSGACQTLTVVTVPLLLNLLLAWRLHPALWWAGALVAALPLVISKYVHPLLHDLPATSRWGAPLAAAFRRTPVFRFLRRYHLVHHARATVHYNLLPGADWLMPPSRAVALRPRGGA